MRMRVVIKRRIDKLVRRVTDYPAYKWWRWHRSLTARHAGCGMDSSPSRPDDDQSPHDATRGPETGGN